MDAEIARHRKQFLDGCIRNGYTPAVAEAVYRDIEFFANYGFNKAHAADYAMITCQTAFLKAHYPVEYMTALLSVSRNDTAKIALYTADCRRMSIPVLAPDVNSSGLDFTIESATNAQPPAPSPQPQSYSIRLGMGAIKNVGAGAVQVILDSRDQGGSFPSLDDFCQRVDLRQVGKRALEYLIKVGALDKFGERGQLLEGLDQVVNASASHFRAAESGQLSLFGVGGGFEGVTLPKAKNEISRRDRLAWEKELIGLYVSDHPLQPVMDQLQLVVTHYSQELNEEHDGKLVTMAGVVTNVRPHQTKKGDPMGFVSVEDLQGHLELVVFPRAWKEISPWVAVEQIVFIKGKVDAKGSGSAKILVDSLSREFKVTKALTPTRPMLPEAPAPWWDDELPLPTDEPEVPDDPSPTVAVELAAPVMNVTQAIPQPVEMLQVQATPVPAVMSVPVKVESHSGGNGKRLAPEAEVITQTKPAEKVYAVRETQAVYQMASAPSEPRCIVVTIQASGDKERDNRRMRRIHGLLTSYPGMDSFEFRIYEHDQRKYQLRFPNETTGYCPALAGQLTQLLGPDSVEIRTL